MQPDLSIDDPNLEQRRNPRVDLFEEIACEGDGVLAHSRVADISVGGVLGRERGQPERGQVGVQCRGLAQSLGFQFP